MTRTYTVILQWIVINKGEYKRKSKMIKGLRADNMTQASEIALETVKDKIYPAIACIWYDWPQKGT